ncbi:SDR family NAD(P)-dependent oxidoreductase [Actinoalloteichus hymeniacidonis]|uniref:Short-chain alcohol dehydrogenase n=1 Tax=Actinoalloteichus hymeniacidonis TaxID=340345 RepID=A0AAC9HQK3_9PSEU|nr:SDR family NAD(P)-dependent oxidoreductase [Actinoalloteichus hymeniacidonis]AOS63757.1 short-chain alcohol dehydrogenase [Actinoalloteichus hymeniacidonis]MBB5908189.1 NAD(P)-dependent dehydrogenase (short-subunit alcohol dehydrogenase family) [Actinoalloteichus hymeniacidonis]
MPKVWFVTGSSRGLGRSIVENALAAGDRVAATARRPVQLTEVVERYGDAILPLELDVANAEAAATAVEAASQHFGRIDVVVNNAGYGDAASVEDVELGSFRAQLDTNFYGVVYVSKAVLPILRKQGSGHIVQISSLGGRLATPGLAAYQSAKWAVGGFSSVLAQEVAPLGVKVTVLEPGGMRTDWAGSSMTIPPISEPYQQTVGAFAEMVRTAGGTEPTDPVKVAQLIRKVVELPEPPLRLLVGADAVQYAGQAARWLAESDEQWRHLSESVSESVSAEA